MPYRKGLPREIMGRSIHERVIPTVCNLKNMLTKLKASGGDVSKLKPWEKSCYKAYNIELVKREIMSADSEDWPKIIRDHILNGGKGTFGTNVVDIYLIAYVAYEFGSGKEIFSKYIYFKDITERSGSINAIWTVGRGDGEYLGILNKDGSIKDMKFIERWIGK